MRKLLKRYAFAPERLVTDDLRSYGSAARELGLERRRERGRWKNNRAENSHQPTRRRERKMHFARSGRWAESWSSGPQQASCSASFTYALNRDKLRQARRREGRYLLRTNLAEDDPADLWAYYLQLVAVEEAFKTIKGDLAIRPIFHQNIERIEAHIFVAFLAYLRDPRPPPRPEPSEPDVCPSAQPRRPRRQEPGGHLQARVARGPLADSRFHHRPDPQHRPDSRLEAAYHRADTAIQRVVDLLAAA